jgi:hypothetical protein
MKAHNEVIYERNLKRPHAGVVEVVKVTVATHGFDGFLGICAGHPSQIQHAQPMPPPGQDGDPRSIADTLLTYLQKRANENCSMTAGNILADWTRMQQPASEVSVATPSSSVSTITQGSQVRFQIFEPYCQNLYLHN